MKMIITIQPTPKNPEKQVFKLSEAKIAALEIERFESVDSAKETLNTKQAVNILNALVRAELFTVTSSGIYKRTALGTKVTGIIAERQR